ncbi:RBBP9/YdeN family alpha/beta hydrolase [Streptomyces sp. NPDC059477]|uniref:RBBP9/YdeN family alpha/beta hydrolase n=1 Tax=Streptomyces sp. NPDC059477 TaxID=3346847 RepID=UPI0036821B5B
MTSYLILHGWQNHRPEQHWQHWLADRLDALGHQVVYPQLPDPDEPELEVWLAEYGRHLAALAGPERVVVAHSLSVLTWLHAVARGIPQDIDRVLLVAPPSYRVVADLPEVAAFGPPPLDVTLRGARMVGTDNDPYCPEGAGPLYAGPLGIPVDVLPGAGHLDLPAGYGAWPGVLDWCLDGEARVTGKA